MPSGEIISEPQKRSTTDLQSINNLLSELQIHGKKGPANEELKKNGWLKKRY